MGLYEQHSSCVKTEAVSPVWLVWPDHFSVGCWSRSQTWRRLTGLAASAPTCCYKYMCVYDVQLVAIQCIPLLAVVALLSLALHVGLL